MTWTTPKTWAVDELVTASMLNTHLRDNLTALKTPPSAHYEVDESSDYTTTSTSFEDVDGTNLSLTITTNGGDVMAGFVGSVAHSLSANPIYFNVAVDGDDQAGDDGLLYVMPGTSGTLASFVTLLAGLSAGEHTIALRWRVNNGTGTLWAGAGTTYRDVHPQFWVREVS